MTGQQKYQPLDEHTARELVEEVKHLRDDLLSRPAALMTHEEHEWLKLAIKREAQSVELRRAIIEKTLTGLAWAAVLGVGAIFLDYLRAHGWKG